VKRCFIHDDLLSIRSSGFEIARGCVIIVVQRSLWCPRPSLKLNLGLRLLLLFAVFSSRRLDLHCRTALKYSCRWSGVEFSKFTICLFDRMTMYCHVFLPLCMFSWTNQLNGGNYVVISGPLLITQHSYPIILQLTLHFHLIYSLHTDAIQSPCSIATSFSFGDLAFQGPCDCQN
jgi:hypothetical protein